MSYGYDGGGEQGPGPGIDLGRLVRYGIGILIALFAVFSYAMKTQRNPVTGEVQHIQITPEREKQLGLQAAPEMAHKMGGAIDPKLDARAKIVSVVGQEIIRKSEAARSAYAGNFHFYLLDDPKTINAFALPGGQIFITKALFERLHNEGDLAGVLGHEVGHVVARHSAQQMAKGELGQQLTMAVGVGSGGDEHSREATMAAMMANQMIQLKYGRGDESEADKFGLKYMAAAGYDPTCMLEVMNILKDAGGDGREPAIFATHPHPEDRIVAIKSYLAANFPNGIPPTLSKGKPLPSSAGFGSSR